jgi:hypothetical protein
MAENVKMLRVLMKLRARNRVEVVAVLAGLLVEHAANLGLGGVERA